MKKNVLGILALLLVFMTGCFDDDDDRFYLPNMYKGFGILQETEDQSPRIILDDGEVLIPVASNHNHPWNEDRHDDNGKPIDVGDRLLVNFTILSEDVNPDGEVLAYFVRLNSTQKILLKNIVDITPEIEDSIGNDPIAVRKCWVTDSLINFKFEYLGRDKTHFINLVKTSGDLTSPNEPIQLELRHNDYGDERDFVYSAFVSFRLNELKIEGQDSVKFTVNAQYYSGDTFEKDFSFVYEE